MQLRRETALIEAKERYIQQDKDRPNRKLVEKPCPAQRIQKKSILTVADDLSEKYQLPETTKNILQIFRFYPQD